MVVGALFWFWFLVFGLFWQEGFLNEFTEMEREKDLVLSPGGDPTRRELKPLHA